MGLIFMNYWLAPYKRKRGLDFITQTRAHFLNVAGEDHVSIGSYFDGFTDRPDDFNDASSDSAAHFRRIFSIANSQDFGGIYLACIA